MISASAYRVGACEDRSCCWPRLRRTSCADDKAHARTLAEGRGIRCVVLDYDTMRGIEREGTLFRGDAPST